MKLESVWLAVGFIAAVVAHADGPPGTNANPALLYRQSFLAAPDLTSGDRNYLFTTNWQGLKLPERFGKLVSRYDAQFRILRDARDLQAPCDWGVDLSQGPLALLPHLAHAKTVGQVARLRAMW